MSTTAAGSEPLSPLAQMIIALVGEHGPCLYETLNETLPDPIIGASLGSVAGCVVLTWKGWRGDP